jgi:hypothetical protein
MGKEFHLYVTTVLVPEKINVRTKIHGAGGETDMTNTYGNITNIKFRNHKLHCKSNGYKNTRSGCE